MTEQEPTPNDINAEVTVGWALEAARRARSLLDGVIAELENFPELAELTALRVRVERLEAIAARLAKEAQS